MTRQAILRSFDSFFSLPPGTLAGREPLAQLSGWDSSLGVIEMLAFLDKSFGKPVSAEQLLRCQNVNEVLSLANLSLADDEKAA